MEDKHIYNNDKIIINNLMEINNIYLLCHMKHGQQYILVIFHLNKMSFKDHLISYLIFWFDCGVGKDENHELYRIYIYILCYRGVKIEETIYIILRL